VTRLNQSQSDQLISSAQSITPTHQKEPILGCH